MNYTLTDNNELTTTCENDHERVTLWREEPEASAFLMQFGDAVWSCRLKPEGSLEKLRQITEHQALGNMPKKYPPMKPTVGMVASW